MFTEALTRPAPPSRRGTRRASQVTVPAAPAVLSVSDLAELRSLSDDQLGLTSFETLLGALRLQWNEHDQLASRVELAQAQEDGIRAKLDDTLASMAEAVSRYEEGLQDQDRLESEVQGRNELLERLRQRLASKDAELRESERRFAEQERSFEAERQAFITQEAHHRAKVHSRILPHHAPIPQTSQVQALQEELETMTTSQDALKNHIMALTEELNDLKKIIGQLREENDGWQALVTDQTMTGSIRKGGGMMGRVLSDGAGASDVAGDVAESPAGRRKRLGLKRLSQLSERDDQAELANLDDDEALLEADAEVRGENLGGFPVTGSGLDLAAELGRAEVSQGAPMRVLGKGDEGDALRAELRHLRDANKALSLYCAKIIDRIIAKEGYEDILAADHSRDANESTRLREVSRTHHPLPTTAASSAPLPSPIKLSKAIPPTAKEKRARRGMSVDWGIGNYLRSFGSTASLPPVTTRPGLRPLSLSTNGVTKSQDRSER